MQIEPEKLPLGTKKINPTRCPKGSSAVNIAYPLGLRPALRDLLRRSDSQEPLADTQTLSVEMIYGHFSFPQICLHQYPPDQFEVDEPLARGSL